MVEEGEGGEGGAGGGYLDIEVCMYGLVEVLLGNGLL